MGNLILPHSITKGLPFPVTAQLADLPEEAQREFYHIYDRNKKSTVLAYILQNFVFQSHYLYLRKIGLQILYWLTGGGFGIWWLIDLFRMPKLVREYNEQVAEDALREVVFKYKLRGGQQYHQQQINRPVSPPKPKAPPRREFRTEYDPTNLRVENLRKGYLVDFDLRTWTVTNDTQFDWDNQTLEKSLALNANGQTCFLVIRREAGGRVLYHWGSEVNIYALDPNLESEILSQQRPQNILTVDGTPFYRESRFEGTYYQGTHQGGTRVLMWEYLDGKRENFIRVEQLGRNEFRAIKGRLVDDIEFSEILPGSDY